MSALAWSAVPARYHLQVAIVIPTDEGPLVIIELVLGTCCHLGRLTQLAHYLAPGRAMSRSGAGQSMGDFMQQRCFCLRQTAGSGMVTGQFDAALSIAAEA